MPAIAPVPLAWQADQMETIPGLCQPEINDLVFWDEAEKKFVNRIKPITSDCQDFTPAPRCDRCPDWGGDGH